MRFSFSDFFYDVNSGGYEKDVELVVYYGLEFGFGGFLVFVGVEYLRFFRFLFINCILEFTFVISFVYI